MPLQLIELSPLTIVCDSRVQLQTFDGHKRVFEILKICFDSECRRECLDRGFRSCRAVAFATCMELTLPCRL